MLTAIRQTDKKKVVGDWIEKDLDIEYRCEFCNEIVIHHKAFNQSRIGHFKHNPNNSMCPNRIGESPLHYETKLSIYKSIKGWSENGHLIELERWINNKSQRPDIYIETNKKTKIAIEVQASQLTKDELIERTQKYFNQNIHVFWILPYDYHRFYSKYNDSDEHYYPNDTIRLKDYELLLYYMNYKQLYFWNKHDKSEESNYEIETFIKVDLEDEYSDFVEYYNESGEHVVYESKKYKNIKRIKKKEVIFFTDLEPKSYKGKYLEKLNLYIPDRLIMMKRGNLF